jgi:hypothetical protein
LIKISNDFLINTVDIVILSEVNNCPVLRASSYSASFPDKSSSLTTASKAVQYYVFAKLLRVCDLEEALFRRSAVHKLHAKYTMQQIRALTVNKVSNGTAPPQLAHEIVQLGRKFGYDVPI